MRFAVIDGFRGVFLIFMMIIHANEILHTTFGKLNHHYFGWVEDAQGFVFMSGLVVGFVYGGRFLRSDYDTMRKAIHARIRTIYSHQLGLILIFLIATLIFSATMPSVPNVLHRYADHPISFSISSALLVTGSTHMGILPMYIFFMFATPFAMGLLKERQYFLYAFIIGALWALSQTHVIDFCVGYINSIFVAKDLGFDIGIFFNVFGWQALFFTGLMIGFLMTSKRLKIDFLQAPEMKKVFYVCLALFVFYGIYDRIVFDYWFGTEFSLKVLAETDRGNLSTIYPITFFIDLVIVIWLLGPGMTDENPIVQKSAKFLRTVVTWRPLVFLGQHSLHVFSAHILIVYVIAIIYEGSQPTELTGVAIILLSLAALYAVAWWHAKSVAAAKLRKNSS